MKLIVGLGNPGEKYAKTRHNLGFMVVEQFLKDIEPISQTVWQNDSKLKSDVAQFDWQPKHGQAEKVILAKPLTYMNNSGLAVKVLSSQLPASPAGRSALSSNIWIVHDDVDLPLGAMKIRFGGASAGHRGVTSIIDTLRTDRFWRFRMGIGHPRHKFQITSSKSQTRSVDDYVLSTFAGAERGKARELVKRGAKALATALEEGLGVAMNRFNAK